MRSSDVNARARDVGRRGHLLWPDPSTEHGRRTAVNNGVGAGVLMTMLHAGCVVYFLVLPPESLHALVTEEERSGIVALGVIGGLVAAFLAWRIRARRCHISPIALAVWIVVYAPLLFVALSVFSVVLVVLVALLAINGLRGTLAYKQAHERARP